MTVDRQQYATAREADVEVLRESFERGDVWTKVRERDLVVCTGGAELPDRRFRAAVAALRDEGTPIVSWSEEGSAYRLARSLEEADRFVDHELIPRFRKLERQARRIREKSRTYFNVTQPTLL